MKWVAIFVIIVGAVATAAIALHESTKSYIHRYRLTVAVDANGSALVGSSVVEVVWLQQTQSLPINVPNFVANVHGEATVLDLGDGRALVALLGPADPLDVPTPPEFLAMRAYGLADGNASIPIIAKQKGVRSLEGKDVPALILFRDISDPRSAKVVKPADRDRHLASDLRLLDVTIEITSQPVTRDIDKKLPWWTMAGRPAVVAWRAWLEGQTAGPATEPETLFRRG
jgi:hypothetical protein